MSKLLNLFDRVTLFLLVGWPEPDRAKVKAVAENRARAANLCGSILTDGSWSWTGL
jgi:hypothetical protein